MMKVVFFASFLGLLPLVSSAQECEGSFNSGAALYRCAIRGDRRLSVLEARKSERVGREIEAGERPNPIAESELSLGSEGQQNLSVLQPFELGGRRTARLKVATAENQAQVVEDEAMVAEVAADVALAIVRIRHLRTSASLFEETKASLQSVSARLRAKAVLSPEERSALSIFSLQSTVLDTQLFSLRQELRETQAELGISVGRRITEKDELASLERKEWPEIPYDKMGATFESRIAALSVEKAEGELLLQKGLAWPELAIGPAIERNAEGEHSLGVKLEFSIPIFSRNTGARQRSQAELHRSTILAGRSKLKEESYLQTLHEQYRDLAKLLKSTPSQSNIKKSVAESLKLFSRGMIQPSAVIETYRSSLETLEAIQEKELTAYRLYWKLQSYAGNIPKEFL